VSIIMARVPERMRRFRLPSPRVQASGRNGPGPGETAIWAFLQGLSRGCFKTWFMQEHSGLQAFKRTEICWTDASQGPYRLPNAPLDFFPTSLAQSPFFQQASHGLVAVQNTYDGPLEFLGPQAAALPAPPQGRP
jgi:hypothetical protein